MNAQPRQAGRSDDTTDVAASIPPADTHRRRRARRWAIRHLDAHLGIDWPPVVTIDYARCGLTLDYQQRDRVGRQLLAAGWTP